ncbi:MAG: hypothetical protein ACW99G_01420 [Candidatus Thorarchaeota archaeon]
MKNKDGTPVRLKSPNPLGKTQDKNFLKEADIILHNFNWSEEIVDDLEKVTPLPSDMKIEAEVKTIPIERPEPESSFEPPKAIPVEVPVPVQTIPVETPEPTLPSQFKITVSMFCLPGKYKTVRDELYGDSFQKRVFGKKFSFESIMLETGDLGIHFWTTVPHLTKGSIVYPYCYSDGQRYGEFRWWEISNIEEKSGGYLVDAIMSTLQPDFSD